MAQEQHTQETEHPIELPKDVWGLIWDKLSVLELAKVAPVAKAWRSASVERIRARHAAAVARVMAPDAIPDSQLSMPQRIFRAMRRHLLGLDAFSGERVFGWANEEDNTCMLSQSESALYPAHLYENRMWAHWALYVRETDFEDESTTFACMGIAWGWPVSPDDPYNASTPMRAGLWLKPRSPQECEWMQGLLLALSEGSLGEACPKGDQGDEYHKLPGLRGLLARCTSLTVLWTSTSAGRLHESKDLVLLPMFHNVVWKRDILGDSDTRICWRREGGQ